MEKKNHNQKDSFNSLSDIGSKKADDLHQLLKMHGVNFATGVPCGVLKDIIKNLLTDKDILHITVNRESEAVGVAVGAYLSGNVPVIYMQNSGMFTASNDIGSLLIPYRIPILFIVSYRGCEGEDAVQHLATGRATEKLLNSFDLYYEIYKDQDLDFLVNKMFFRMKEESLPVFLLLKRGWKL